MSKIKLKDILAEAFEDTPTTDRKQTIESVKNFGVVGKSIYGGANIMEIAQQLADIAEGAHNHVLSETDDWFDKVSVNKNMKSLKGSVMEFQKTAKEAHGLNQRLTGLYEDIGHVLNRYYEIDEPEDGEELVGERLGDPDQRDMVSRPEGAKRDGRDDEAKNENVDWDKAPAKDGNNSRDQYAASDGDEMNETSPGHRTDAGNGPDTGDGGDASGEEIREDKGDMDNDGKDEPDSEEYMDNKDKAIKKAMSKESLDQDKFLHKKRKAITKAIKGEGVGGVVGIPSLGDMIRNR